MKNTDNKIMNKYVTLVKPDNDITGTLGHNIF